MQLNQDKEYADQYSIEVQLGGGGQARVYLGKNKHHLHALKIYQPFPKLIQQCRNQAKYLQKLSTHRNFIQIIDYRPHALVKFKNHPQTEMPMLILEYAQGGDLSSIIYKQGRLTEQVSRTYIKQLLSAIQYLVEKDITHRDLKLQNILFDKQFTLKIADFGFARDARGNKGDYILVNSGGGTQPYLPPERITGKRQYTGLNTDLFATGIILFYIMTGCMPFPSTLANKGSYGYILTRQYDKFWKFQQKKIPQVKLSNQFKRLMNIFFTTQVDRRPTFEKLSQDDWMNGPTVSDKDLLVYMQEKVSIIAVNNPKIKKIQQIKQQIQLLLIEQQQKNQQNIHIIVDHQQKIDKLDQIQLEGQIQSQPQISENQQSQEISDAQLNENKNVSISIHDVQTVKQQNQQLIVIKEAIHQTQKKNQLILDQTKKQNSKYQCNRGNSENTHQQDLLHLYTQINSHCQQLPQHTINRVVYVNKNPGFLVTFLRLFLAQQLQDKEIFIDYFDSQVQPIDYHLQYSYVNHSVSIKLQFLIDQTEQTFLRLNGYLHHSKTQKTGIEWQRVEGDSFWLYSIQNSLNDSLLVLV